MPPSEFIAESAEVAPAQGADVPPPSSRKRRPGIAPARLLTQVENTAAWALQRAGRARPRESWRDWLLEAPAVECVWQEREGRIQYLQVMLAAHFATVATLVPTDVDTHIRHHIWQELDTGEELAAALQRVDEAAAWDPRPVSARVVQVAGVGDVCGHAGEWLAVRAGALGRALALGEDELADRLISQIDRELAHEAEAFTRARERAHHDVVPALCLAAISAHNCGDLSRVIEAYPRGTPRAAELAARFARLGHEGAGRYAGAHHLAGHLNKEVMASENHRFLALRAARCLRSSRALIVPFGPFLYGWGQTVGSPAELGEESDRGEVLAALVHGLAQGVDRWGYHRAVAGLHHSSPGGIDRLERYVPARLRKLVQRGPVRDALRVDESRFLARVHNAWRAALVSYRT